MGKSPKLTLILTTHERHNYLKRALEYLNTSEYSIIITDSSEVAYTEELMIMQHIYIHTPGSAYIDKICKALAEVTTPYVLLYPDDDFIVPEAIKVCLAFLDNHLDYSCVQGNCVGMTVKKGKVGVAAAYVNSYKRDISDELASLRVEKLLSDYIQTYYSIFRTEVLRNAFNLTKSKVTNLVTNEVYISVYSLIAGKHIVLPIFYFAREVIENSAGARYDHFDVISSNEKYKEEYSWFLDNTSDLIYKKDNITKEKALQAVKSGIQQMVKNINDFNFENSTNRKENKILLLFKKIYKYRILKIYWILKKGYPIFFRKNENKQLENIKKHIYKHCI